MPRERKRRAHYPASEARPPTEWVPPSDPGEHFMCAACKCRLTADACCRRQQMTIIGTPEPRFVYCHHDCVQGAMVRKAMPRGYTPRKRWDATGLAFRRRPGGLEARPEVAPPSGPDPAYAVFVELHASVATPLPTRDD